MLNGLRIPVKHFPKVLGNNLRAQLCRSSASVSPPTIGSLLNPHGTSSTENDGKVLTVSGFVRSVRRQKKIAFVAIGDGSTLDPLQVVLDPKETHGYVKRLYFVHFILTHS